MAKACKHCGGTQFNVKLVGEGKVDLINDSFELIEQGDINVDENSLVCANCNQPVKMEELIDAMVCTQCKELAPIDKLVEVEVNGVPTIMCQECYSKMSQPDLSSMSKEQLIAYIQQMQGGTDTAQQETVAPTQVQAPVQEQALIQEVTPDVVPEQTPVTLVQQAPVAQAPVQPAQPAQPVAQPTQVVTQQPAVQQPVQQAPVQQATQGVAQQPMQSVQPTQAVQQAQTAPVETNIPNPNIPVEENVSGISVEGASFFNDSAPF